MRITGGEHRSRILRAPRGDATRPTSDRVREAVFAILLSQRPFEGLRVLDLYAGTGALAFEALSRGAAQATLVESSRAAVEAIHANARSLGLARQVNVVPGKVEGSANAASRTGPFDLIFADPPYALVTKGEAESSLSLVMKALTEAKAVSPGARIVVEHGKGDDAPTIAGLTASDTRRYGDTSVSFYEAPGGSP